MDSQTTPPSSDHANTNAQTAHLPAGMAITAMVLAIVGLIVPVIGVLGIVAGLILGIIALTRATAKPPTASGKGFAIAAISISGAGILLSCLMVPIMLGILLPALGKARQSAMQLQSSTHLRMIANAATM